jgi:acyl transferase domain-containing protein
MEPIAVIGHSFRLPGGVEDVDSFWDMVEQGKNVMKEWPKSRTNIDTYYKPGSGLKNTARRTDMLSIFLVTGNLT